MKRRNVALIAGARPNFMKVAPIMAALEGHPFLTARLVHTGQHYDDNMSEAFFQELGLPAPDHHLGVGSDSHGRQTARIMIAFENVLPELQPDIVLVVGDVNSTIACSLVAVKRGVPVGHVEAGLRSFDRTMPEEVNRVLTDRLADLHFITEESARRNLEREGIPSPGIRFTGNTMIDTLIRLMPRIEASAAVEELGLEAGGYAVVTLHRPTNVDHAGRLAELLGLLERMSERLTIVFPVHPRTRRNLEAFGLWERLGSAPSLRVTDPLPYTEFLALVRASRLVLTDSGGIQEETTYLGVPCITQRTTTERPITTTLGTNVLTGDSVDRTWREFEVVMDGRARRGRVPPLWDGRCAERIVRVLEERLGP